MSPRADGYSRLRPVLTALAAIAVATGLLTACDPGDSGEPGEPGGTEPTQDTAPTEDPSPTPEVTPLEAAALSESSLSRIAAALPTSEDFPEGYALGRICPASHSGCQEWTDGEPQFINAFGWPESDGDDWVQPHVSVTVTRYDDADEAQQSVSESAEGWSDHDGEFDDEAEQHDGYFVMGERGTGDFTEYSLGGDWADLTGYALQRHLRMLNTDGEEAAPWSAASLAMVYEDMVLRCEGRFLIEDDDDETRSAEASISEGMAVQECHGLLTDYLERLADLPESVDTPFITPPHLVDGLPDRDDFDDEYQVLRVCPEDEGCDEIDHDSITRLSVHLPLPDGVEETSDVWMTGPGIESDFTEFIAEGGTDPQHLALSAYLDDTVTAAEDAVARMADSHATGEIDSAAHSADDGSPGDDVGRFSYGPDEEGFYYGLSGEQTVEPFEHGAWSGHVRIFEGNTVDLQGRAGGDEISITIEAHQDRTRVVAEALLTAQGHSTTEAEDYIGGMVQDYLDAIDDRVSADP